MKLVMSVRETRDMCLRAAGEDNVARVNTVVLEHIMDKDTSLVNRVRKGVSDRLLKTATIVEPGK